MKKKEAHAVRTAARSACLCGVAFGAIALAAGHAAAGDFQRVNYQLPSNLAAIPAGSVGNPAPNDRSEFRVIMRGNTVELTGKVASESDRRSAVQAARELYGMPVLDELRVGEQ